MSINWEKRRLQIKAYRAGMQPLEYVPRWGDTNPRLSDFGGRVTPNDRKGTAAKRLSRAVEMLRTHIPLRYLVAKATSILAEKTRIGTEVRLDWNSGKFRVTEITRS